MRDDDFPEQDDFDGSAAIAEFTQELARVGVDWEEARDEVFEAAPKFEKPLSEDEYELVVGFNVTAITDTLRGLPDGAGTEAFLARFRGRQADFGALPPDFSPPPGFSAS